MVKRIMHPIAMGVRILWGPAMETGQGPGAYVLAAGLDGEAKSCSSMHGQSAMRVQSSRQRVFGAAFCLQPDEDSAKFERRAVLATAGVCERMMKS